MNAVLAEILKEDDHFWLTGAGDVILTFSDKSRDASLGVMFRKPFGYLLTYDNNWPTDARKELYVSVAGSDFRELVSLFVGGDFFNFWRDFFVSREKAREAIMQFCATGEQPVAVQWMRKLSAPKIPDERMHGGMY